MLDHNAKRQSGDFVLPRRWYLRLLVGGGLILFGIAIGMYALHPSRSHDPLAIYPTFYAVGHPEFAEFVTSSVQLAPIYLQLPDKRVVFLPECTETDLVPFLEAGFSPLEGTIRQTGQSYFFFRDGKLVMAAIRADLSGFRIGSQRNGPFYRLPISREILLQLFGKPTKWQRASRPLVA